MFPPRSPCTQAARAQRNICARSNSPAYVVVIKGWRTLAVRMNVCRFWIGRILRLTQLGKPRWLLLLSLANPSLPSAQAQTARRSAPSQAPAPTAALSGSAVPAERTPPPPFDASGAGSLDENARARARALYDQGAQAYNESRYYLAATYFLDAYRVYPTPQLLFNVAKAHDKLSVNSSALAYYREYLRKLPNAPDAAEVTNRVHELEAALAQRGVQQLSVLTTPPRALLAVDGASVGITPWTGETWPGEHRLTVTLEGRNPLTPLVTVDALRAQDFSFNLEPARATISARDAQLNAASKSPPRVSALTWLTLGTATAAMGATLASEMVAKNTSGLTRTGAFFGGIGIATSVLGGVLLYLDLNAPDATPTQKRRAFIVGASGQF